MAFPSVQVSGWMWHIFISSNKLSAFNGHGCAMAPQWGYPLEITSMWLWDAM